MRGRDSYGGTGLGVDEDGDNRRSCHARVPL